MLRPGRVEQSSELAKPFWASLNAFSGAPVPPPAMRLAVLMSSPIIQTPLLPAARANR